MSEPFDPYRKWLGIPPKDQPANHYRLLGIATFENDPDVIENAATRQMAHVRTFKTGRHATLSQKILNELSAAKLCLLTPEHKQAYDVRLRAELAAAGKLSDSMILTGPPALPPAEPPPGSLFPRIDDRWRTEDVAEPAVVGPPPVPIPMPVGTAVAPVGTAVAPLGSAVAQVPMIRGTSAAALRARRSSSSVPLALTVVSLVLLVGAAVVAALVFGGIVDLSSLRQPAKSSGKSSSPVIKVDQATGESAHVRPSRKSKASDFPVGTPGSAPTAAPQSGNEP